MVLDAGTRKPLHETIRDLKYFKNQVIASKQFADDPNSVMDSIINLIEQTTEQVEQAMRNGEVKDRIETPYPDENFHLRKVTSGSGVGGGTALYPDGSLQPERQLVGLVSGKPMSFPVQPPIWSFPESSLATEDADDWLMRLLQGVRSK
jgi:hypothetical protein